MALASEELLGGCGSTGSRHGYEAWSIVDGGKVGANGFTIF